MDYLLDLLQGLGIAAAIGIRPFLPTLAGRRAWPHATSGWTSTTPISPSWSRPGSCSAIVVAVAVLGVIDRRRGADTSGRDPVVVILLVISLVLGALFAAGSIADHYADWWPGLIVGPLAAALGFVAARSLFGRVRARLDDQTANALPLYAEGSALVGRRTLDPVPAAGHPHRGGAGVAADRWSPPAGEKYAGLRIW